MKTTLILLFLFWSAMPKAQDLKRNMRFELTYNNKIIALGENHFSKVNNDSILLETVKFYLSNLNFYLDGQTVGSLNKKHMLVDFRDTNSTCWDLPDNHGQRFNEIRFQLGVDSATNVSGAMGGDLDPIKGMYWTWNSGYINFKMEGRSNLCPARNNLFQFHIGGYTNPFKTIQNIQLNVNDQKEIVIAVVIDNLLDKINLRETYEVMSPGKKAVAIAELLPSIFKILR